MIVRINNALKGLPAAALPIGLGCSRLGSVNGASGEEARAIISRALDGGIRFFDTSNIYGQGDSERILGDLLSKRDDCIICSKAGKYLDWKKQALVPLKGLIRATVRKSAKASESVQSARAKPMPMRWDSSFLTKSIEQSLKRLRRERIEMFMLHSPPAQVIKDGQAIETLERLRNSGKLGFIGVSVDDVESANACLRDARIQALQIPVRPGEVAFNEVVDAAASSGVAVIAREILGGHSVVSRAKDPLAFSDARISEMIAHPSISVALVGTTKMNNLNAILRSALNAQAGNHREVCTPTS